MGLYHQFVESNDIAVSCFLHFDEFIASVLIGTYCKYRLICELKAALIYKDLFYLCICVFV